MLSCRAQFVHSLVLLLFLLVSMVTNFLVRVMGLSLSALLCFKVEQGGRREVEKLAAVVERRHSKQYTTDEPVHKTRMSSQG